MTSAVQFAQKREEAIQLIRAHAPARLQDPLIALLRPAIALSATRAEDSEIPLGASKFGGAPDVPPGFEWPMWEGEPLDFLGQINLEEVVPFDLGQELPKSGWLSFFASIEDGGMGEDDGSAKSFHFTEVSQRASQPTEVVERDEIPFSVRLQPHIIASMLNNSCAEFYEAFGEAELKGQWKSADFPRKALFWPRYQILGYPDSVQTDVRYESMEGDEDWRGWRLLFQIAADEAAETEWGDAGLLYWTIREEDLRAQRFDRCRFIFQCC